MARARLRVDVGETWLGRLTRANDATAALVAVIPAASAGRGIATVRVTGPDRLALAAAVADADPVVTARRVETADEPAVVTVETRAPFLQAPMQAAGVPFEPPMTVADGVADLTVTAGPDRLEALTDELAEAGHDYTVASVRGSVAAAGPLTDRQETVLAAAVEAGYYETPRACTLSDVAAAVDAGKAAVSETLRRAEGRLARQFLAGRAGTSLDAP